MWRVWFSQSWWGYLLRRREPTSTAAWWRTVICRAKGHPEGEVFYNAGGLEPDHSCRGCGDVIG